MCVWCVWANACGQIWMDGWCFFGCWLRDEWIGWWWWMARWRQEGGVFKAKRPKKEMSRKGTKKQSRGTTRERTDRSRFPMDKKMVNGQLSPQSITITQMHPPTTCCCSCCSPSDLGSNASSALLAVDDDADDGDWHLSANGCSPCPPSFTSAGTAAIILVSKRNGNVRIECKCSSQPMPSNHHQWTAAVEADEDMELVAEEEEEVEAICSATIIFLISKNFCSFCCCWNIKIYILRRLGIGICHWFLWCCKKNRQKRWMWMNEWGGIVGVCVVLVYRLPTFFLAWFIGGNLGFLLIVTGGTRHVLQCVMHVCVCSLPASDYIHSMVGWWVVHKNGGGLLIALLLNWRTFTSLFLVGSFICLQPINRQFCKQTQTVAVAVAIRKKTMISPRPSPPPPLRQHSAFVLLALLPTHPVNCFHIFIIIIYVLPPSLAHFMPICAGQI